MRKLHFLSNWLLTLSSLVTDVLRFIALGLRPRLALSAENLFLRKQLALDLERETRPRRPSRRNPADSSLAVPMVCVERGPYRCEA
jgi:hypothetical protein